MMAVIAAGLALTALLASPHLLVQTKLTPTTGIALWSAVLMLRAALAVCLVLVFVFFVPATQLFTLLTHWCFHAVVPFIATHLGFNGHSLGDAATLVPALVAFASFLSVGYGAWRGARAVRGWLTGASLGPGPAASLIVGGSDVVVAAAGLRSPRVVVSAGALLQLDDDELAAGLQHEWGHVHRRHGYVSLVGHACRATSCFLPGGHAALAALQLQLERDADAYAIRKTGDRLALASAICKAAGARTRPSGLAIASLAGSGVTPRLRQLTLERAAAPSRMLTATARAAALVMVVLAIALVAATPALAEAGVHQLASASADRSLDCE